MWPYGSILFDVGGKDTLTRVNRPLHSVAESRYSQPARHKKLQPDSRLEALCGCFSSHYKHIHEPFVEVFVCYLVCSFKNGCVWVCVCVCVFVFEGECQNVARALLFIMGSSSRERMQSDGASTPSKAQACTLAPKLKH